MTTQRITIAALGVALLTCIGLGSAPRVAAQTPAMPQALSPAPASSDSTITYPQLTLGEVIERALTVSPIVASGTGSVRIAGADRRMATGAYIPTITATSEALRTDVHSASSASGVK